MFSIDKWQQQLMKEAFYHQLHERCRPAENPEQSLPMITGIETEYLIVDSAGRLVSETQRNDILAAVPHSSPELGVSTLETHTYPVPAAGTNWNLLQELRRVEQMTIQAARNIGCRLVRIGTYPGPFADFAITQKPERYQWLVDLAHFLHRVYAENAEPIQVGDITLPLKRCDIMSGCQSVHINIQMPAGNLAVHLLNKTLELIPYLVALGAHGPIMNCQPSGFHEYRVPLWGPLFTFDHIDAQYDVDTNRTGLPEQYYTDWLDYWHDVGNKLFFTYDAQRAFDTNMKQFWRVARLKPCPNRLNDCILEVRALSTQPTVEEDAAFSLLVCGLLDDLDWCSRPLLPFDLVKTNLDEASKYGLGANLYVTDAAGKVVCKPAATIATGLIEEAHRIWSRTVPAAAEQITLLQKRLIPHEESPALASLRLYEHELQAGRTREEAAQSVLMTYVIA